MNRPFFKRIYVEITNICNLSCPFCPGTERKPEFMTEEKFTQILDQVKGYTKHLCFHVMGEPLLHPLIGRFLELAHEYNFKVNLVTNGSLIHEVGDVLADKKALRQISFSLHGLAHESTPTVDQRLQHIFSFITQIRRRQHVYISLRLWNMTNHNELVHNQHILERITREFCPNEDLMNILRHDAVSGISLGNDVFLNPAPQFAWPNLQQDPIPGKAFCYGLRNHIGILVDGTVIPCCLDSEGIIGLGNIHTASLQHILTSPRAQNMIKGFSHQEAIEPLCKRCGYRTRFTKNPAQGFPEPG